MAHSTTELLASIKRRANIPTASGVFSDTELLSMATEELRSYIVPLVLRQREEFWLSSADLTLTSETSYPLPRRAIGGKLAEVSVLDNQGREMNVPRISPADLQNASTGFYMDGRGVRLFLRNNQPPTILGTKLRLRYYVQPGALILTTDTANCVQLWTTTSTTITYQAAGGWSPANNDMIDIVRGRAPFDTALVGVRISGLSASTFTPLDYWTGATASTTGLAGGNDNEPEPDWVCRAGYSPVVQAPLEFHDVLAQKVAVKVFESKGMTEKLGSAREELGRMEGDAVALISPRVDGETQRAVSRNGLFRMRW